MAWLAKYEEQKVIYKMSALKEGGTSHHSVLTKWLKCKCQFI